MKCIWATAGLHLTLKDRPDFNFIMILLCTRDFKVINKQKTLRLTVRHCVHKNCENMGGFVWPHNITTPRHKSQCFLFHCSKMEKVGGWQSQERWISTRNQRRDFPTQVPSTQPLTQPRPQHAKEQPVITETTVVLNLDTVPRLTPTLSVHVCLLQLAFDISCFQPPWTSQEQSAFFLVMHFCATNPTSHLDVVTGICLCIYLTCAKILWTNLGFCTPVC